MKDWTFRIPELTPAQRDFLRVLRAAANGEAPREPPTDWAAVLDLATLHQVDGFLYSAARSWDPAVLPAAPLLARWRTSFLGAAVRYTRVAIQLRELLEALHAAEIPVIPLKGAWLAERVYEDGSCRPMSDVDLLVRAESLELARTTVERSGYERLEHAALDGDAKHVLYLKKDTPLRLELHVRLSDEGDEHVDEPDPAAVWSGLQDELLHGVPVPVFPPERQVVFLAHHILHHALAVPLRAYLDLVLLGRRYAPHFNPDRLEEEARQWRIGFGAKFVMQIAGDIWNVPPPAPLAAVLKDSTGCEEARCAAMNTALQLNVENRQITPSLKASLQAASRSRRFGIGLSRVLVPPASIRQNYPDVVHRWGLAGGYVWRCADLIRRYGRILRKADADRAGSQADLANFAARQSLSAWIRAKESQRPPIDRPAVRG